MSLINELKSEIIVLIRKSEKSKLSRTTVSKSKLIELLALIEAIENDVY